MKKRTRNTLAYVCSIGAIVAGMVAPMAQPSAQQSRSLPAQSANSDDDDSDSELHYPISSGDQPVRPSEEKSTIIDLDDPDNAEYSVEYDAATESVTVYRKIGGVNVKLPYTMTADEYRNDKIRRSMLDYWQSKQGAKSGPTADKNGEEGDNSLLNSRWKVNSNLFTSVFGSDQVSMKLQGQAKVSLGVQFNKIDNPTLQERMRKTTSFDFDQSVQMNLNAQIGEKMKVAINYNTEATFDFENEVKLDYTGDEDDIIQDIEAGNISWNLPGTLIQGSQSLFGFKIDMRFGKLDVSTVFSQKKGETSSITVQNGATSQEFDIDITDYEKNKHFFLSHQFKENYDNALKALPNVNSQITIDKIEVWVTNKTGNYTDARNIVAFVDLAETGDNISNTTLWSGSSAYPSNSANNLYDAMTSTYSGIRTIGSVTSTLTGISNFKTSRDYEKVENARMLSSSEYTLNEKLGYISLNSALNNNEVLAVAYQYTYRGRTYKVGEFSSSGVDAPQCLILKLLKGTTLTPDYKNWSLMMKNIYSLGAYDIKSDGFDLNVVYLNDSSSTYINYFNEGKKSSSGGLNGLTYLQILNVDRLNSNLDVSSDGKYDFVNGYTIDASKGRIIFIQREPFGSYLAEKLSSQPSLAEKYAFTELYEQTQVNAKQVTKKNKFKIRGSYESDSSSDISLNAYNIAQGSVVVTAGGQILTENLDYTVDYSLGRVKILNQSILNSGSAINISYENESAISTQTQTLIGAHLNYQFSEDFNVGATVIHMKEQPLTYKVSYGDESISNTMLGANMSFNHALPFVTKALDALPLVSTKEESSINFEGEIAKLIAGHNNKINASYIDDFEGSSTSYDIINWTMWKLASKPEGQTDLFSDASLSDDLSTGFDRAHMAWYTIDPLFLRNTTTTPRHIRADPDQQSSHYVREVYEEELYPNKESAYGESTNISVLNVAYYPRERGSYNLTTDVDYDGFLQNPESNWAGIQRKLETTDFETANVEYIEFWLLDPFIYNADKPGVGGDLYFNVGTISEDVLKDGRRAFEHGLPTPDEEFVVDSTNWGYIPQTTSITNGFNTDAASMYAQDVGLNGMSSARERYFYNKTDYPFLDEIEAKYAAGEISQTVRDAIYDDPANDNYHYYRGSDYDAAEVSILDRYKRFNMTEGNSCPTEYSSESYSTASVSTPDNEDLNSDYTLNETENYYQYKIALYPDSMEAGKGYIANTMETTVKLKNGKTETVHWYQYRIPLNDPDKVVGDISDMSSMQFMRMFMTNFSDTCILRFATLELVKGEWRKYTDDLWEDGANPSSNTVFETATVNIEEDDRRTPVNYVLPPGVDRTVDPSNPQLRQLNEQAYSLKVTDLGNADARAVYKTLNIDLRNYKRLKMYVHAEAIDGYTLEDDQMALFVRLGTDYEDNYYEYEIPLKLTPAGTYSDNNESDRYAVWPEDNELDIPLDVFTEAKLARNEAKRVADSNVTLQTVYSITDPDKPNNRVSIKGNPSIGNVVTMMIGLRARGAGVKSAEVWINELRLTEFNERGGWAARGRATIKLADLGTISAAGQYTSIGFGSVDQSVLERSMAEETEFDLSASLELAKLIGPKTRWSIPFYAGYSRSVSTPEYSPFDTDVKLSTALATLNSKAEQDSLKKISQTTSTTKSINLTNVRIKPEQGKRAKIYSPSNLSATYAHTEIRETDPETEYDEQRETNVILAYNYTTTAKPVEPFKKSKLNSKYFALIRDANIYWKPTLIGYRWEFNRDYQEVQKRNVTNPDYIIPVSVSKDFLWNRYFDFKYNLTRGLRFTLNTVTNARIDEPDGPVNKKLYRDEYYAWRDSVWSNFKKFGRTTSYQHQFDISYTVPINKLPYLDFLSASAQYKATYNWEAGSINTDYDWGNTIYNYNTIQLNSQANLSTIYNKSKYLKDIYQKYNFSSSNKAKQKQNTQTVRYTENKVDFEKGKEIVIRHNLKTTDITARAFDEKGHGVKGVLVPLDENSARFTPTLNGKNGRVVITGTVSNQTSGWETVRDIVAMAATSLKNISVSYSENNSTTLPGYLPGTHIAGLDNYNGYCAPGFAFIAGWQDRDFAMKAVERGWITSDTTLNEPYIMTHSKSLQIRASFEMFKALKLEFNASRTYDRTMNEYYVFNADGFDGVYNTTTSGSFSMSTCAFRTAFKNVEKTGAMNFSVFNDFLDMRETVARRLAEQRRGHAIPSTGAYADVALAGTLYNPDGYPEYGYEVTEGADGFGLTQQDVLIPAFIAAYTGKKAKSIFLDFIPGFSELRPNWKLTFSGLNNIKKLRDYARNIEFSHAYTAKYSIGGFESSLDWVDAGDGFSYIRDLQDNFVPEFEASTVTISEQFNPLFSISATFVNNMTTSFATNRSRTVALSLSNNQVSETYNREWTLSLGYRFDKLNLIFGKGKNAKQTNNDLNLTFGLSRRDNFTIVRRIEELSNELASGTKTTTIKFSADYAFSQKFSMQFYYDQTLSNPYVSSSYPTNNVNVGVSFQLSLSE